VRGSLTTRDWFGPRDIASIHVVFRTNPDLKFLEALPCSHIQCARCAITLLISAAVGRGRSGVGQSECWWCYLTADRWRCWRGHAHCDHWCNQELGCCLNRQAFVDLDQRRRLRSRRWIMSRPFPAKDAVLSCNNLDHQTLVASFLFFATQYEIPFKLSISTFHVSVMAITPAIASHNVRHPSSSNFSVFMACDYGCRDRGISEHPVWITFSGLPGPERTSTRQTQAPSTTLSANQIRMRVIFAHPPDEATLTAPRSSRPSAKFWEHWHLRQARATCSVPRS
jgi:hypothetical protein